CARTHWLALDDYSCRVWCTKETAIEPSPTADATRLMLPALTSPTAKIPGLLVSSKCGGRGSGHWAARSSSCDRSEPVLMNPRGSSVRHPWSQLVLGWAPVITKTWRMSLVSSGPPLVRQHTCSR